MNIFLALLLLKVFISLTSTRDKFDSKLKKFSLNTNIATKIINVFIQFDIQIMLKSF